VKRVLVFNFFAGLMDRGIPLYARNIIACMRRVGLEPIELCCPRWLHGTPRPLLNVLFVVFEQVVAPLMRVLRRCRLVVYPYNSAGIVDAALGRSVLIIHDFIGNGVRRSSLAARYITFTQAFHRRFKRPVVAASAHTLRHLRRLPAFRGCLIKLWTNPFYSFEEALSRSPPRMHTAHHDRLKVLLCSGLGQNKDFRGALRLFASSHHLRDAELRILGFGNDARVAERWVARLPMELRRRITVLPRLDLEQVVMEYLTSDLVWVHSAKEGFGRSVVEARLSGRTVLASNIGAFRRLHGPGVYLYRKHSFDAVLARALGAPPAPRGNALRYHQRLEASVSALTALYFQSAQPARLASAGETEADHNVENLY